MKIIKFKEVNINIAENQDEYLTLPAHVTKDGVVISCWKPNFLERIRILLFGRIWLKILTFNKSLQPQRVMVNNPFKELEVK